MFRRPFFISTFLLNFKTVCFADFAYHACRDSMIGGFVNQNKRALGMVVFVCGSGKWLLGFEADAADVVELERFGRFGSTVKFVHFS